VVEPEHHRVGEVGVLRVVYLDPLQLVLDADGLFLPFEVAHAELLRQGRRGAGGVDDDLAVDLLIAVVADADWLVILRDGAGDPRVEPVLRALLPALRDEELLELGELEHGARLFLDEVVVRRLKHHVVGVVHHHVVGDAEGGHHRRERPCGRLVALTRELVLLLGLEDDDVVASLGEVAGALGACGSRPRDNHVKTVGHERVMPRARYECC
jgi:hypothetical protein